MYDIHVVRNQFGANNTRESETLSDQPVEDRTKVHEFINDFDEFNLINYNVTGAAFVPVPGDGGIIQASGGSALQTKIASYQFQTNYRLFANFVFSLDGPATLLVGLVNATTTPLTPGSVTDGLYLKSDGSTFSAVAVANGTAVTQPLDITQNVGLINLISFKVYWDGGLYLASQAARIVFEVSGTGVQAMTRSSFGGGSQFILPVAFPTATLVVPTIAFSGSATMNIDLLSVVKDRLNLRATPPF